MKKIISVLLAALMLAALAACGTGAPQETSVPEVTAHYRDAGYYTEDNTLVTIDYYDENGHIIGDEVYDNGVLTTYELFQKTENFSFEIPELEDSPDVVSTEYMELLTRPAEEGNEYHSSGMVFVFGYDADNHMRMAKVFALDAEGNVLFTYIIYYQLDEHGNFTGWTHMTEAGEVLFEMQADNVYDGDMLASAEYHYTRYGSIVNDDAGYHYQAQDETTGYTLHVLVEY